VQRIQAGDHVAAAFHDDAGFAAATLSFVREGLRGSARVLVFPKPVQLEEVRGLLSQADSEIAGGAASGTVEVFDSREVQLAPGGFDPTHLHNTYAAATRQAALDGFRGLWVSVDMTWADPGVVDTDALVRFETEANSLFASGQLTAVCLYDRRRFSATDVQRAGQAHPCSPGGATFRYRLSQDMRYLACAGEADLSNLAAWAAVVDSLATTDPVLDISAMTFLDVPAMAAIGRAALRRDQFTVVATPSGAEFLRLACQPELDRIHIRERYGGAAR
jgi:hypothetical protein